MNADPKPFTLLIHGGAWDIPGDLHRAHLDGLEKAAQVGLRLLKSGEDAVQAVISVVKTLENDPAFDAGYGSFLNMDGEVEMDAIVMSGRDLSCGAVAAIQNVANPVEIAEMVRTRTEHLLLTGQGATRFAQDQGIPFCDTEKLLVGRELERYRQLKKLKVLRRKRFFEAGPGRDTVGAVARDQNGHVAAATSTGGTPNKIPGRVGDSPIPGAGAYADDKTGAASCTGYGESIMQVVLAKTVLDFIADGLQPERASLRSVQLLADRVDGRGGLICVDRNGQYGYAYNTPYMARAIITEKGIVNIAI